MDDNDKNQLYAAVTEARALVSSLRDERREQPSEATMLGYKREMLRLSKKLLAKAKIDSTINTSNLAALIPVALDTKSRATWYRRKAAIQNSVVTLIEGVLKEQNSLQRQLWAAPGNTGIEVNLNKQARKLRMLIGTYHAAADQPPIAERRRRSTKKRSLQGLPETWREDLAGRICRGKYALPYLVTAVTGCRPAELQKGVVVTRNEAGHLVVEISGAKVTEFAGQKVRRLVVDETTPLGAMLAERLKNGPMTVSVASGSTFSTAVRDAGRAQFKGHKQTITPYSLRHQLAADMKAAKLPQAVVSAALGHSTDKTATYYGDSKQGRNNGRSTIVSAEATRHVRKVRKEPPNSSKKEAATKKR